MRLLLIALLFCSSYLFAKNNKNILILNSYHKGFQVSDSIIKNIESKIYTNKDIHIDILYMDAKQIYSRDYIKELSELYALQLKNRQYDLVITIDRFAYKFAVKNYSKIFTNEKILFTGVEQFSKELARIYGLKNKIFGIIQKLQIKDNISLILKTMPNIKKLYILNDRSPSGNDSSSFIIKAITQIKSKIDVEYLRDDTLEELKLFFKNKNANEAILFVRYSNDINGVFYKKNEVLEAINDFDLPVFVTDDLFMKDGVLGGKVISIDKLGILTANKAMDILYNKKIAENIHINNEFEYIFDYNILNKYKLKVPIDLKSYQLINKPLGFFQKNRNLINSVFILSPILIITIAILIFSLYSKLKTARQLKQRVEFDKVLLNSISSPIFWKDSYGNILDANQKFCELINIPYSDIKNNKLNEFKDNNKYAHKILAILNDNENDRLKNSQFTFINYLRERKIYYINSTQYINSNSNQTDYVTIFTDITKEKQLETQRLKQTQYMVQQSKLAEIGEIFSSIAHQWKSPLVAITALAQDLFYSHESDIKEEDSYHINNIMLQVQYMTQTINEFQDFIIPSKEKTYFNIENTIHSLLNIVKHTLKYNYIKIDINIKENTNLELYGYENELMQAILNIINNSKDALLSNESTNRYININIQSKINYITIDIVDNGGGIPLKMQKKIFLQYFSTKDDGHGIGLYMTKLIIEDKMDGKIKYKHTKDGSSFRIKFRQGVKNENINT